VTQLQDLRDQKSALERQIDALEKAEREERAKKLVLSFPAFMPMSAGSYEDKVRLTDAEFLAKNMDKIVRNYPLRRIGNPDDVAPSVRPGGLDHGPNDQRQRRLRDGVGR
jgi:hypothetical protein